MSTPILIVSHTHWDREWYLTREQYRLRLVDLIDAITTRLWPLGDDTIFLPGHGPHSSFAQERRTNPYVADSVVGG